MPKKRKTRKEKERTSQRKLIAEPVKEIASTPLYSISKTQIEHKKQNDDSSFPRGITDVIYLKQDIRNIIAAGGLVIAFDIVLYVLLLKGLIRLPLFGY